MKRKINLIFFFCLCFLLAWAGFSGCAFQGFQTASPEITSEAETEAPPTESGSIPEDPASSAEESSEEIPASSGSERPSETPAPSEGRSASETPGSSEDQEPVTDPTTTVPGTFIDPAFEEDHPEPPPLTWLEEFEVPAWSGSPYAVIHDNIPFFSTEDLSPESYEIYYALDSLGRCTLAEAVVGPDLQPKEKRGNISMIRPTGWHSSRYSFVNGESLYNRCHLIAYYLTAENANPWNLVTGTSYMNRDGMNDFENLVGDYVKETGNHVRYRVTPKWTGENLLCDGLLVEGWSIEDQGEDICFCIFAYNVQPGVYIDYLTGDNHAEIEDTTAAPSSEAPSYSTDGNDIYGTFILNKKNQKFHRPDCSGATSMSEKNREEYTGSRNALILDGYQPCPSCNP